MHTTGQKQFYQIIRELQQFYGIESFSINPSSEVRNMTMHKIETS